MLQSVRSDLHAPPFVRTFTSFAADQSLHSVAAGCPVDHLPSSIFVVAEAGDVLAFTDALGTANIITFTAAFYGTLPFVFAQIIGTTTTVTSVTVAWNPEP